MPGLAQSLGGHDLGYLLIVAESWGIPLEAAERGDAIDHLVELLPAQAENFTFPEKEKAALLELATGSGRSPWAQFTRQYGELREMGPARRDKEQPHRHPVSITENLWYRGLIGRAFFDSPQGLVEFAYIPDELLAVLPLEAERAGQTFGRPARPEEKAFVIPASDKILDEACTLLAGLRLVLSEQQLAAAEDWQTPPELLQPLLKTANIFDDRGQPNPKAAREFLEADRAHALAALVQSWLVSAELNELRLIPELIAEGNWTNDPLETRKRILEFARSAPPGQWWSIAALISDVKTKQPDFQRPAGDYETWYLRDAETGQYLRGFEHWERVDGALMAFMLRGPFHWLGLLDLASPSQGKPAAAFRWSAWSNDLIRGQARKGSQSENLKFKVDSRGVISVPRFAPRAARYQLSRFAAWLPAKRDAYQYQITSASLETSRKQGLQINQLVSLLKARSSSSLPPNLLQALKRWEQHGAQARLNSTLVLRVHSATVLKALRASRAARYLGELLGPAAVTVKKGAAKQVLQALAELGYLGDLSEE